METFRVHPKITFRDYQMILAKVFDALKSTNREFPYKVFVSGEGDSNQTDFETQSNHAEIGVLANSKRMGQTLLLFLRCIVDRDVLMPLDLLIDGIAGPKPQNAENYTIEDVLNVWEKWESQYVTQDSTGVVKVKLNRVQRYGKKTEIVVDTIEKQWWEMDIWTLKRIEDQIAENLEDKCNGDFEDQIYNA